MTKWYLFHSFVDVSCIQYNNWFTFSEYEEPVTIRSTRPVHARELAMVSVSSYFVLQIFSKVIISAK